MKNKQNNKDHFRNLVSEKSELTETEISTELQLELKTLSKMADTFAPKPLRPIEIPEPKSFSLNYFSPVLACSLALLLVVFTYKIYFPAGSGVPVNIESVYQEMETDEIFMNEVASLVEDVAYSDFYPEMTEAESKYEFSDDFIEVIVPI